MISKTRTFVRYSIREGVAAERLRNLLEGFIMYRETSSSNMVDRFCELTASVFYIGYSPVAPGTIGSFAALFLYYFLKGNPYLMAAGIFSCFILGLLTAGRAECFIGGKDSGEIVIDEFTGMLVSLFLLPPTMGYVVSAFILFRFFDIIKPRPIKSIENFDGSLGIMLDDVVAGVYANVILQVVYRLF